MKKRVRVKGNRILAACLAGILMVSLGGCGSPGKAVMNDFQTAAVASESSYDSVSSVPAGYGGNEPGAPMENYSEEMQEAPSEENTAVQAVDTDRKLIKTVNLHVETKEFDTMMTTLTSQIKELGGYIENMDTYNGSSYSGYRSARSANMTIRIPKNKLDGFLDTVSGICNVVSRSEYVEDVTLTYVDLESHRDALEVEQERLLSLLEQAETIEDILTIESRLSNVRYQLESMESQLRTYDNQVDYSTVHLDISEVKELTPVEEKNGWQRMTEGFVDSLKSVGNGFKEFVIWFVIHIPYLVVWAAIILAVIFGIRGMIRHSRKKKAKKAEKAQMQQAQQTQTQQTQR